ncbi:MAG: DUF3320 domain-containing protein [Pyrinomonadaceae bacterium]
MLPITPDERIQKTVNIWKNKLLDLTKRNRALNFKINRVSTVTIIDKLPAVIFRLLCLQKKSLKFRPQNVGEEIPEAEINDTRSVFDDFETDSELPVQNNLFARLETDALPANNTDDLLQTNATPKNLDKSLRRIDEQARSIIEEQGVNALYLSLGMLHYTESKDSEIVFKAPLILVPVEINRGSANTGYKVSATDEEVIVNPSLAEYLHQNFGISLPELPDSSEIADDYDLQNFFELTNAGIANQRDWSLSNEIYLGLFSFQKLAMYKDLENNVNAIGNNRIFQQIINKEGNTFIGLPDGIREINLDEHFAPENCMQVVDADSSQLRAIATVSQNYDLVLQGPPGTGKSQTITNLIAQALATGKSVLFVAEKMAALDVVHRRLCEVGLGEFCLELHSTKANKRSVMQELRKALDASLNRVPPNEMDTQRLAYVRNRLTLYVNAVHEPYGTLGVSPFQIYGEFNKTLDAREIFLNADIANVSAPDLDEVLRDIDDLAAASDAIGSPQKHPWRETVKTFYSQFLLNEIEQIGTQLLARITTLVDEAEKLESILGLPHIKTLVDIEAASAVSAVVARSPGAPFSVLVNEAWNNPPPESSKLIETGRRAKELRRLVETNFIPQIFDTDPTEEIEYIETKKAGAFGFKAFFARRYRTIKKRWLALRLPLYEASLVEQAQDMRLVSEYLTNRDQLVSTEELGSQLFGSLWQGESSNWDALENYVSWVLEFRQLYIQKGLKEQVIATATQTAPDLTFVQTLRNMVIDIEELLTNFAVAVGWPKDYFSNWELSSISSRISEMIENLNLAPRWASFEIARQKIETGFANEVLDWILGETISFIELPKSFRRAFYQKWLTMVVKERIELREFNSIYHEQRVKEFKELDEQILRQNRSNLVVNMRNALQLGLQDDQIKHQKSVLHRELNKQRKIMPLRVLMKNCLNVIRSIKPCFMMSPQTVAQLLDAQKGQFDLVLFDEASQLPTEDAVGSIVRGRQLVVVGDQKQLPPTNFFAVVGGQVNYEKDEDDQPIFHDSESVLEEVQSSGVPSSRLKWHYRSAHESLITFSNVSFYDADLHTFPSNETEAYDSGLQFEYVAEGIYEGKGLNLVEARCVADAVVEHARVNPDATLGVGTFNLRQQIAIQDELESRRRNDPRLEPFFDRSKREPFFVKNLENIQGDERDVIFLSVTYAKARDGRLRYNFGPLNNDNGWRRMNVLTTRARKQMKVFSSIKSSDIQVNDTTSKGAKLLRDFLRYAELRLLDSPTITGADTESPFEREVLVELTRRGVSLEPQVGVSGYKIDFGVYDDEVRDKFVCGLECDGVAYHSSESARDRDRLRQQVLERRGWEIHRVWSTDWFKDREGQIERLLGLIEQSRETERRKAKDKEAISVLFPDKSGDSNNDQPDLNAFDIEKLDDGSEEENGFYVQPEISPYRIAAPEVPSTYGSFLYALPYEVEKVILEILESESPIHKKDLFTRVASVWGQRAGSQISSRIEQVLRSISQIQMRNDFVYASVQRIIVRRRDGTGIPADRIATEEIREAILLVLRTGHKFEKQELINEVRKLFGFNRTGASLQNVIEPVVDQLIGEGILGQASTGIGLCN